MRKGLLIAATAFGFLAGGGALALAQSPEVEKPCMADAARLCQGVEPGGGAQLACLKAHKDELSPECKKKVMQAKIKKMEREELQKEQPQPTP